MADRHVDVLLIGGGLASASCATQLREDGFGGSISLVGRELDPPYHRPPGSKGYLQGAETLEDALVHPVEWYDANGVELLLRTSVTKLDTAAKLATLSTKDQVSFDQALIATGANVRRLNVDGSDLDGLHYLRTLRNADSLREDVADAAHVVLIGGSYIGCEVAASLTLLGKRATIVMQEEVTFERGFGATAGTFFQETLTRHGIEVHGLEELERFEGADGRVSKVVCASGLELECDAVVLGVGATPDVMLARSAGLALDDDLGGVRCDDHLRTSADGIFAAGDICAYDSLVHGRRLRVEHWDVASEQGKTAARNIAGEDVAHEAIPYFFSDLADWTSLEYVGPASSWDAEVVRGSIADGAFSVFYLDGGRVAGALAVGRSDDLEHARRLIASGADVGAHTDVLEDVAADLGEL